MKSVCILYGLGEGPRTSKRFRKALSDKGYTVVTNPAEASLIVAHSGGYLLLPPGVQAKRILNIGPYWWPNKSWFACARRNAVDTLRAYSRHGELSFWIGKNLWSLVYLWRIPANWRMFQGIRQGNGWQHGHITAVARPRFDAFCTPNPGLMRFTSDPAFVSLPGYHDDCWRDPEPYIALLQS